MNSEKSAEILIDDGEDEDMLVSQLNVDISNQYVIFSVGDEEYGVPILAVQEIISMQSYTRIPGIPEYIKGIINLRGNIIPLYLMRTRLGFTSGESAEDPVVVIIQLDGGKSVGFVVDSVSDVASIPPENLREKPDFSSNVDVRYIDKIGSLGSRMIVIINLENFLTLHEQEMLEKITHEGRYGI